MSKAVETALKPSQSSTDDERLAFISETSVKLSTLADPYPLIVHLLSMIRKEADTLRDDLDRGVPSAPRQSGS